MVSPARYKAVQVLPARPVLRVRWVQTGRLSARVGYRIERVMNRLMTHHSYSLRRCLIYGLSVSDDWNEIGVIGGPQG